MFSLVGIMTEEPNTELIHAIHIITMIDITITTNNCSDKTVNPMVGSVQAGKRYGPS